MTNEMERAWRRACGKTPPWDRFLQSPSPAGTASGGPWSRRAPTRLRAPKTAPSTTPASFPGGLERNRPQTRPLCLKTAVPGHQEPSRGTVFAAFGPHPMPRPLPPDANGIIILTFGIRHGRKSGHGHLVGRYGNLCLSETKVLQLASCTMSKDDYIQHLKDIGGNTDRPRRR